MTSEVVSAILFSTKNNKIKVGCSSCLDKANNSALIKSILLGWWLIPSGIFSTIKAINDNLKCKKNESLRLTKQFFERLYYFKNWTT